MPDTMTNIMAITGKAICLIGSRLYLSSKKPPTINVSPATQIPYSISLVIYFPIIKSEKNTKKAETIKKDKKTAIPPSKGVGWL